MAEPIGIASGVLTLAVFAFQSSVTLYETIQSFQSHLSRVRGLLEELEALTAALKSLTETIASENDTTFAALELPLRRCDRACKDFEQELLRCLAHSGGTRTSFRDWARLIYMGDNIDGFKQLLTGYKSTVIIALTDANLRKTSITAERLESYKELVKTATDDLEAHLQSIEGRLENAFRQAIAEPSTDGEETRLIEEDRLSTLRCLQVCAKLSEHINEIQLSSRQSRSASGGSCVDSIPERLTVEGLQGCKDSLAETADKLEVYMHEVLDRLVSKASTATSKDDLADLERLRDEWRTTRQCIDVCAKAGVHLKEKKSTIDNYATGDAFQFMVSTDGTTIDGRNRGLGHITHQVGGHLSDVSLQKISADMLSIRLRNESTRDLQRDSPSSQRPEMEESMTEFEFQQRHGPGSKLVSAEVRNPMSASAETMRTHVSQDNITRLSRS